MSNELDTPQFTFTPTQDWFSHNIDTWTGLFHFVQSTKPRILEIGSWEGRSGVFLLTHLCRDGGDIVCIDHFDLMGTPAGRERHVKVTHNLSLTGKPFRIMDEFSVPALMTLLEEEMSAMTPGFDWIYVDGSHEADDTFLDGELVWRLARKGAIVIFDDYRWDKEPEDSQHHPKRGIDTFMSLHDGEYERLSGPSHYQMILRKTSDMRIGFLVKQKWERSAQDAFGYGIHLVLALDSQYAMPAAVTIRSAIENTPGRITVYVVDCGLSEEEKAKLKSSIPRNSDTTLMFLRLPENSVAADMGAVWAKVDMIRLLPVERALYLDSDVLVRADLKQLWNVDLQGKIIGAVPDVGFPRGHEDVARQPYFNAGVLLMDLAEMRGRMDNVTKLAREMRQAKFRDQDFLNIHFSNEWMPLKLRWNAQGLGTYATLPSKDRDLLCLEDMSDPHIVHFTGPVNPGLVEVLNPYLQPCTAKPWGFNGAPGHPYAEEWWAVQDRTAWSGIRASDEYRRLCEQKKEEAVQIAIQQFRERVG
jgi:predicted O-methyltransferase YrrM